MTEQHVTRMSKPCESCECDPCDCDWGLHESRNQSQKATKSQDKKKNR